MWAALLTLLQNVESPKAELFCMLSAALQHRPGLPSVANTAWKVRSTCKIFGAIFGTQNPVKNGAFQTGPPQYLRQAVLLSGCPFSDNAATEAVGAKLYTSKWPLGAFAQKLSVISTLSGIELDISHVAGEKNDSEPEPMESG